MKGLICLILGICFSTVCFSIENQGEMESSDVVDPPANSVKEKDVNHFTDVSNLDPVVQEIPNVFDSSGVTNTENSDISFEEMLTLEELSLFSPDENSPSKKQKRNISSITEKPEKTRLKHAKELLGHKQFKKSIIAKEFDFSSFKKEISKTIKSRLSEKNQKYAKKITKAILSSSKKHHFDPIFVAAIIQTESSFDPKARGTSGEIGLMQLMPETASWIAQREGIEYKNNKSLENPVVNIKLGVAYMAYLRDHFKKNPTRYIAAYNMGANNVKKLIAQSRKPTTYPIRVLKNYQLFYISLNEG